MRVPLQRLLTTAAFFLATCAVVASVYMANGWGVADSICMVVITIFGVGYGEVRPVDTLTLSDIDMRGNRGFLIVAVRRSDGEMVLDPPGDCPLAGGDAVIVLGHAGELPQLEKRYSAAKEIMYRGAKMRVSE